ncbi:DUF3616 domain-containing protein [Pseudomonas sp. BF-B-26]|uniref:DUF3616 domain-containing protein n=1 Tax=Pseudomonas sp. BF-B-26 TaxID=2832400 RepID=UPI001CC0063F|nr:DUF3616 domain-containing protein [Pseudomonas sp. BF-B-26]
MKGGTQKNGRRHGNDLAAAIAEDPQLRDFLRIPGKDNDFDIEGLVMIGSRLLLGLRGPVLRGWAVLLEIGPELNDAPSTADGLSPFAAAAKQAGLVP